VPIIATAGDSKTYTPAPEGVHHAVCVDVIDLGMVESSFVDAQGHKKLQHKINVAWQLSETRDDGKRYLVFKRYTLSLNEKATLRKDLESWRGRAFTRDEEMGFDVETVIGINCLINVQHRLSADGSKTYANVVSVMPLIKGMPKIAPLDYKRPEPKDAAPADEAPPVHEPASDELTDDDIPF
jgi:hypothetical protein